MMEGCVSGALFGPGLVCAWDRWRVAASPIRVPCLYGDGQTFIVTSRHNEMAPSITSQCLLPPHRNRPSCCISFPRRRTDPHLRRRTAICDFGQDQLHLDRPVVRVPTASPESHLLCFMGIASHHPHHRKRHGFARMVINRAAKGPLP
jgi:hypothetical protein